MVGSGGLLPPEPTDPKADHKNAEGLAWPPKTDTQSGLPEKHSFSAKLRPSAIFFAKFCKKIFAKNLQILGGSALALARAGKISDFAQNPRLARDPVKFREKSL